MGYKVKAVATYAPVYWLSAGKLTTVEGIATYYAHPSAAIEAARRYMNKTGESRFEFWLFMGNAPIEKITAGDPEMRLSIRVVCRSDGSYRASTGKHAAVSADLKTACCRVVKLWEKGK